MGIELNFKRTVYTLITVAAVIAAVGAIKVQCNSGIVYAQEKFVRGTASDVFDSLHRPFEGKVCALYDTVNNMREESKIIIEMIKIANADKPDLYRNAKNAVRNAGRFPVDN
ncbi:MAG TPA: hypothetical protein VJ327_10965 [Patescibacteria group bacterium]|nr:hypothetical protein [Patescibacteria group bacterium]